MGSTSVCDIVGSRLSDIHIVPLGFEQNTMLDDLAEDLIASGFHVSIEASVALPFRALDQKKNRYQAQTMLNYLRSLQGGRVVGVMQQDLYSYIIKSIKGMADFAGRAAIISLCQLLAREELSLLRQRICKLTTHELGHTYGLEHCENTQCVMHDAVGFELWDKAENGFCEKCCSKILTGPYLSLM